jgi:hypothetical protein
MRPLNEAGFANARASAYNSSQTPSKCSGELDEDELEYFLRGLLNAVRCGRAGLDDAIDLSCFSPDGMLGAGGFTRLRRYVGALSALSWRGTRPLSGLSMCAWADAPQLSPKFSTRAARRSEVSPAVGDAAEPFPKEAETASRFYRAEK